MILLWIGAALFALALLARFVRAVAAVLIVMTASAGALLITIVADAAFDLEPSRDTGAVLGLFVVSLAAILLLCRRITREPKSVVTAPAEPAVRRVSPPAPRDLAAFQARPIPMPARSEGGAAADNAADLRRLGTAHRRSFWRGKGSAADQAARRLEVAWNIIETRAVDHCIAVSGAKRSCARLLALEQSGMMESSALDAVTIIRKGVPELVESWLSYSATAGAAERKHSLVETIASIERVAARAEREIELLTHSSADAFAFQRDHLDRRSEEDSL